MKLHALMLIAAVAGIVAIPQAHAAGEVVTYVEPKNATNPPPAVALNAFDRFEISPIAMDAPYAGQDANEAAKTMLQANLDERAKPLLAQWNAAESKRNPPRTLRIEPAVRHIKYITGGKRFFAGAFAGGSAVLMTVKLSDAATGEVIAEPEFYQHANKMGAAWSFGATDKTMLIRLTNMITEYLRANHPQAVGGSVKEAPQVSN